VLPLHTTRTLRWMRLIMPSLSLTLLEALSLPPIDQGTISSSLSAKSRLRGRLLLDFLQD